jgi:hypothetical protein
VPYCLVGSQQDTDLSKMVKLQMGIWAGIAAGGVMVLLCLVPILGCLFSSSKKAKKAALEESAAEKGEVVYSEPVAAFASTPTRPANAALQKPNVHIGQHDIGMRSQSSTPSMSPSYHSQASTIAPQPLHGNTTSNPPYTQPMRESSS